ncbi:MAG TPA: prepilin peptidase, partial [Planctomycetaceae bacterium]
MPFDLPGLPPADLGAFDAEGVDLGHRLTLLALAAFSTVWITALGAAVGSFLNVVIYRLPQGMSLVRPKSRCPTC